MIEMDDDLDVAYDYKDYKQSLTSNFYSILSPPPCQVEEQDYPDIPVTVNKDRVKFRLPPDHPTENKIALRWKRRLENRKMAKANRNALTISADTTYHFTPAQLAAIRSAESIGHVRTYNHDDEALRRGVLEGSIPSAAADSGATSSVGTKNDRQHFISTGKRSDKTFRLPNGALESAHEISHLATAVRSPARDIHITPGVNETSLISTVKFAEAGYITIFDRDEVNIYDERDTVIKVSRAAILRGWREPGTNDLWRIPLVPVVRNNNTDTIIVKRPPSEYLPNRPAPTEAIHNVYELKTQPELIRYLHAAAGFPTKPTWLKAVKNGQFTSWPGLTAPAVAKYFPESEETIKGHARKMRSGLRSTKTKPTCDVTINKEQEDEDIDALTHKHWDIFTRVYDVEEEEELHSIYSDQTGRFPRKSSKGNQYIMVLVHIDSSAILVAPMKDRTSGEMIRAYQSLLDRLGARGIRPKHHVLDNECSEDFKQTIKKNHMTYQLVPPHDHRRNIAEKGIQTFKNHFVAIICGADKDFPLHLWCQLLPQAEHTLNLLRPARICPTVSAYAYLWGPHDYNAHPFAPLGCKIEAYLYPGTRETWAPHTASGYYIGNSHEHYRCHQVYIPATRSNRVCDTVFFKHKYLTMPTITPDVALILAADKLADAIGGAIPKTSVTEDAITQLMAIFREKAMAASDATSAQRVLREIAATNRTQAEEVDAPSQRVENNAHELDESVTPDEDEADLPIFEIDSSLTDTASPRSSPFITQDDYDSPPSANTRNQRRGIITQDHMLTALEVAAHRSPFTAQNAASRRFPLKFLHEAASAILDEDTGKLLEYRHLMKHPKYKDVWMKSFGTEIRRLVTTTETIFFRKKSEIPADRRKDITYGRIVCVYRSEKKDPYRTRITMGGNLVNYPDDCGTPTADIITVKILLNSIVSTLNAKFMTIDLKDFYLMTPMSRYEYFRMKLDLFPEDIIDEYNLKDIVDADGNIFCEVRRGMYGLPQAGIIAQELLEKRLHIAGYSQSKLTPGYWTHAWRPISFTLVVDDFGVKYINKDDVHHLLEILKKDYTCDTDWEGTRYLGLTLDWDYKNGNVHLSMPGYIAKALARFGHENPAKPQHQPHQHTIPTYGATVQYAKPTDTSSPLSKDDKKYIQQVIGTLLYYGRAVDATILVALSSLASAQSTPTEDTMQRTRHLLDYVATHPDAIVSYAKSNMILSVHSDASYLSEPKARSRAGGHFFLSDGTDESPNNGAILNTSQIIKSVMSSAAEAELGALYINAREAVPCRTFLEELGHTQPPTPIQTDNSTALGVVTNNILPRRLKAMDMRYWWLRDRETQEQFRYYWRPGPTNRGDYFTKHHCAAHHQEKRDEYLTPTIILDALRASTNRRPATSGKGLMLPPKIAATAA